MGEQSIMIYLHPDKSIFLGEIRGIVFDWAGTMVDFGCMAPAQVFAEIFRSVGIEVTEEEARGPMGQAKIDHIRSMLAYPRIQNLWKDRFGRASTDLDVEDLYQTFLPLQKKILAQHSDVIPGVTQAIQWCRSRGMAIGSTTGYTRSLMDVVQPITAEAGLMIDCIVCSDEVAAGRPAPWQLFHAAESLGIYPLQELLVIDDSLAGIQAGQHAGCWTAAVAATGNSMGMSQQAYEAMSDAEKRTRCEKIAREFLEAGADVVLDSVAELPDLLSGSQGVSST
jgi:phosphonoacetaldehyde hydrolase